MRLYLFPRLLVCLALFSVCLFRHVDRHNRVMEMLYELPALSDELQALRERTGALRFEVESFESPEHLLELLRTPEYGHLHYPLVEEVWILPENTPLERQLSLQYDRCSDKPSAARYRSSSRAM